MQLSENIMNGHDEFLCYGLDRKLLYFEHVVSMIVPRLIERKICDVGVWQNDKKLAFV